MVPAFEGVLGSRISEAIRVITESVSLRPVTTRFRVENAGASIFVAIGNVDTLSIVEVVTVVARRAIGYSSRPRYINLPDVVGTIRIGVVVDLHLGIC